MNTAEIEKDIKKYKETLNTFLGCYPSDEIPKFPKPSDHGARAFICNTDPKTKPGSHWVSFFIEGETVEFFDTYGRSPKSWSFPKSLGEHIKDRRCYFNTNIVEGFYDNTCGNFCIYMIVQRCRGFSFDSILLSFTGNVDVNRNIVLRY